MRKFIRISAILATVALALALSVTAASAQDYDETVGAAGDQTPDTEVQGETVVQGETAQDTGDDLAFTGRTVGSTAGVAVIAFAAGGVLIALSRRREGVTS